jgi:hypothetical protein
MPTPDQIEANRRNAQKSTGPVTSEGKAKVRLNALKHGLLSSQTVIPWAGESESEDDFDALLVALREDHLPETIAEDLLVQQIAACYWRLRRILRADAILFGKVIKDQGQESFTSPFKTLIPDFPMRDRFLPAADDTARVTRYENGILNQLSRAMAQLDRLQQQRAARQRSRGEKG